jgi:phosphatidylserine/phosphatidylglycerophosphate/cardiolipin synthase-like enzyme
MWLVDPLLPQRHTSDLGQSHRDHRHHATSKLQHKSRIIENTIVGTGSTNFTDTGLTLNANNSIVITDTVLARNYATEFTEMWSGSFHEAKTVNTLQHIDYSDVALENYFSPTDLPAFEV